MRIKNQIRARRGFRENAAKIGRTGCQKGRVVLRPTTGDAFDKQKYEPEAGTALEFDAAGAATGAGWEMGAKDKEAETAGADCAGEAGAETAGVVACELEELEVGSINKYQNLLNWRGKDWRSRFVAGMPGGQGVLFTEAVYLPIGIQFSSAEDYRYNKYMTLEAHGDVLGAKQLLKKGTPSARSWILEFPLRPSESEFVAAYLWWQQMIGSKTHGEHQ